MESTDLVHETLSWINRFRCSLCNRAFREVNLALYLKTIWLSETLYNPKWISLEPETCLDSVNYEYVKAIKSSSVLVSAEGNEAKVLCDEMILVLSKSSAQKCSQFAGFARMQLMEYMDPLAEIYKAPGCMCVEWSTDLTFSPDQNSQMPKGRQNIWSETVGQSPGNSEFQPWTWTANRKTESWHWPHQRGYCISLSKINS